MELELPNNVMNLSLSKLSFELQIPTQTLTKFNNINGNALSLIDRITLTSRSGVILADIPNTHIFGSLVSSVNTKMQDLLTRNTTSYVLPAGATTDNVTAGQNATSMLGAYTAAQASPYSDIVRCNHLTNYQVSEKATAALNDMIDTAYTPLAEPARPERLGSG
jgi:hypothetical protein